MIFVEIFLSELHRFAVCFFVLVGANRRKKRRISLNIWFESWITQRGTELRKVTDSIHWVRTCLHAYHVAEVTSCQWHVEHLHKAQLMLFNYSINRFLHRARQQMQFSIFLSKATHRQTPTLNCAGVHKGRVLDRASASLCDIRYRWYCSSDTSVGRNLFRRPTRSPALSSSIHECSFDTHPGNVK